MTTDDLPPGQPAATRRLCGAKRLLPLLLIAASASAASLTAAAQSAAPVQLPVATAATAAPIVGPSADARVVGDDGEADTVQTAPQPAAKAPESAINGIREKAAGAATATLTALLPRLAASDALPLLDRSTVLAGDLSRLLSSYDLAPPGVLDTSRLNDGKVQTVLKRALTLLGTPYRWGGSTPENGFDCSGLVGYVFRTALGVELPRVSRDMAADDEGQLIKNREELRQGDLVFFGHRGRVNHVGIYVGEGRFLHSPSTGKDVRVDTLMDGYWANKFLQARRVTL